MQLIDIPRLWAATRAHAGLADTPIRLYPYETPPADGVPSAGFYAPGANMNDLEAAVLTAEQRRDFNAHRRQLRVTVFTGNEEAVIAAKLRHELEHVRQWLSVPDGDELFRVYDAVLDALRAFVGVEVRGSAVLYNVVPFEADANAAAYGYSRERLADDEMRRLASDADGVLFRRAYWSADVDTVALRSVCGAALAPRRAEAFLGGAYNAEKLLDGMADRPGLWRRLRDCQGLVATREELSRLVPTAADVDATAPDFAAPWRPLAHALVETIDKTVAALA